MVINIDNPNLVITRDNVKQLGEVIAVCTVRTLVRYSGRALDTLYKTLLKDIHKPSPERNFSDGYDIAQTAICFLCEHIGKSLGDVIGKRQRGGKDLTVKNACFSVIDKYLKYERTRIYLDMNIDEVYAANEPTAPFEPDPAMTDWEPVDEKIRKMDLNAGELSTLNCYLEGLAFGETARTLSVSKATVWRRMQKVQKRYIAMCSV